jgi:hypothetical protein
LNRNRVIAGHPFVASFIFGNGHLFHPPHFVHTTRAYAITDPIAPGKLHFDQGHGKRNHPHHYFIKFSICLIGAAVTQSNFGVGLETRPERNFLKEMGQ